jgi:hypothetical protein
VCLVEPLKKMGKTATIITNNYVLISSKKLNKLVFS